MQGFFIHQHKEFSMKNMKLNVRSFATIALIAVFAFSSVVCFGQTINSPEALKTYLDSQLVNGPEKPIKITMGANDPMFPKIVDVIKSSGKYVSLTLTGNALTTIPYNAFRRCETLVSITIPNSVKNIGEDAFLGCTNLISVTISNSITSIGDCAFQRTGLNSVTIPDNVTSIGDYVFLNCKSLTAINVDNGNKAYSSQDGVLYNKTKSTLIQYPAGKTTTSFTIPNSVTIIGNNAFRPCASLTSVTIPESVTSIENETFRVCPFLTSVTFQGKIDANNFHGENMENFSNVTFVKRGAFDGDLRDKYLAGGIGTYTTTAPVQWNSVWTKQ